MRSLSNKAGLYSKELRERATLGKCEAGQQLPGFDSNLECIILLLSLFFLRPWLASTSARFCLLRAGIKGISLPVSSLSYTFSMPVWRSRLAWGIVLSTIQVPGPKCGLLGLVAGTFDC